MTLSKNKIAIDASRAVNEQAGIGRYTKKLIESLLKIDTKNEYKLFFNFVSNFAEKKRQAEQFKRKNVEIVITKIPGQIKEGLLSSRIGFYRGKINDCDVFLAPTFLDFDFSLKIPQVVVIYDLSMFYYPEHIGKKLSHKFKKVTEMAAEKSDKIITISQSTKKDLVKTLNIDKNKIEVIYPGLNQFLEISSKLPFNLVPKSYILSVGTLEPRKNLKNLFLAYEMLNPDMQNKYPLIIVGAKGWNIDKDLENIKKNKNIIFTDYVNDQILAKLYKEAKVFVYPSLYEGFGFPITEAMQFGTPVITSNLSSMPEAGGEAAMYIDPEDPKLILETMQRVLEGKISLDKIDKIGKEQAAQFSWEKAAREVLELLNR